MSETCSYCGGAPVRGWQGDVCWCGSDYCWRRHQAATCEPNFGGPATPPTPLERIALVALTKTAWHLFVRWIPASWVIDCPGSRRERFAVTVFSWHWGIEWRINCE